MARPIRRPQPARPTRAVVYCRVSTDEQGDSGLGLEAQEAACRAWAQFKGVEVLAVEHDVCSGAQPPTDRDGFARALARLAAGDADALVAAKVDRATRSQRGLLDLLDLAAAYGFALVLLDVDLDTSTPIGRAVLSILGVVAELEREQTRQRTRAALAAKRARGERTGPGPVLDDGTRRWIAEQVERGGRSRKGLAAELNARGVPTATGTGRWYTRPRSPACSPRSPTSGSCTPPAPPRLPRRRSRPLRLGPGPARGRAPSGFQARDLACHPRAATLRGRGRRRAQEPFGYPPSGPSGVVREHRVSKEVQMSAGVAPTTTPATSSTTTTSTTTTTIQPAAAPASSGVGDSLVWTVIPIVISLLALLVARRSARSAARSANLNEQRRREEQAPTIEHVSAKEAPAEGIRIVNPAAVTYTSVRFTMVPSRDEPAPVEALKVEYDEPGIGFTQRWIVEGETWDLGRLGPGEPRLLDLRRPAQPTTGTLRLILDCTTTRNDRVSVIRTCDIPPRPPVPFAATWR